MDKPTNLILKFDPYCDECNLFKPDLDEYYLGSTFDNTKHITISCKYKCACERMYTLFAPTGKGTK